MPRKTETKRRRPPVKAVRKKGKYKRKSYVHLGRSIIPQSQSAILGYCDNDFSLTSSAGVYARDSYSMNGMFDPDLTGTGHQPLGFDQMMLKYDHYQVLGVKAVITITSATADCCVGLAVSDRQTPQAALESMSTFQENPNTRYIFLTQDTANQKPVVLTRKLGLATFFGVPKISFSGETKYTGTDSTNPSDTASLHMFVWGLNSGTATIRYSIRLEYFAKFTEPKTLDAS